MPSLLSSPVFQLYSKGIEALGNDNVQIWKKHWVPDLFHGEKPSANQKYYFGLLHEQEINFFSM